MLSPIVIKLLLAGFVKMLAFDALIGHNDRHPYNWGVIVPIRRKKQPRFAPVYDTARALFWNVPEKRVRQMITDRKQLEDYVNKCEAPLGFDQEQTIDFFRLIGLLWNKLPEYRKFIESFLNKGWLLSAFDVIGGIWSSDEFGTEVAD